MFFTLLAISLFFRIEHDSSREVLVAIFAIVVFTFFYGIGAGPVPFTFSAEVFPLAFRGKHQRPVRTGCLLILTGPEVGMSFSVMVNFIGLSILILFVPRLTIKFTPSGKDDLYGHSNLLFAFTCVHTYMSHPDHYRDTDIYYSDRTLNALAFVLVFFLVSPAAAEEN